MSLLLDHLVILVTDLDQAVADYTALGFTVQRGGTHADGNTHNALVGFSDGSYLELIAFLKPAPQHRWAAAAQAGRLGFVDFALLPASVGAVVDGARERGLAYQGPLPGGRVRPDGERLQWQIGTPPTPDLPFLCGDITPRSLRVPEGEVRRHANGVQGLGSVSVVVHGLEASLERYQALLGPLATLGARPVALAGLGVRIAQIWLGPTALLLLSPGPDETQTASTALRQVLAQRGEGLLAVALRGAPGAAAVALPLALTHAARFEIQP
jgi:catechol 2,3-dioxygenase-like lactoylglutathione lyase family enzyme